MNSIVFVCGLLLIGIFVVVALPRSLAAWVMAGGSAMLLYWSLALQDTLPAPGFLIPWFHQLGIIAFLLMLIGSIGVLVRVFFRGFAR